MCFMFLTAAPLLRLLALSGVLLLVLVLVLLIVISMAARLTICRLITGSALRVDGVLPVLTAKVSVVDAVRADWPIRGLSAVLSGGAIGVASTATAWNGLRRRPVICLDHHQSVWMLAARHALPLLKDREDIVVVLLRQRYHTVRTALSLRLLREACRQDQYCEHAAGALEGGAARHRVAVRVVWWWWWWRGSSWRY